MYVPPSFEVTDRAWAIELIARYPFGLLVTGDNEYPQASHLPLLAQARSDDLWIVGHVARANPHARSIAAGHAATIVFQGAHAYVSASWYRAPYATVPTWNYSAVHICGHLREFDAWEAVRLLSAAMERGRENEWDPRRMEPAVREQQLRGIVAFELRADAIYGKAKLSQNRTETDRERVIERLAASDDPGDRACAAAMRDARAPQTGDAATSFGLRP